MKLFAVIILLIYAELSAQRVINYEIIQTGEIEFTPGISIPKVNNGYTVWLPESDNINGLILFTHLRRDTLNSDSLIDVALENNFAVMYAGTDNRLEFFFENEKMEEIENYLIDVINKYNIKPDNLLFCGMSLEGTRALRLTAYLQRDNGTSVLKPKAIAICDAPLDMVRFHKEMVKAKELNFTPATGNEGQWVSGYLEKNLGGTPAENLSAYINYSPYTYSDKSGGENMKYFKDIYLRAYTEPDVNWWIETRRKDYYSMNAIDLAGFVNELKILGNGNAELILTTDKGYQDYGSRHPHTWNIVNEKDLIEWFVNNSK